MTIKLPEPITRVYFDGSCGPKGFYRVSQVSPCEGDFPVYTHAQLVQAVKDALEEAADLCEETHERMNSSFQGAADAIRAMKEDIQ